MGKKIIRASIAWMFVAAMVSGSVLSWMPARAAEAAQRVEPVENDNSYAGVTNNTVLKHFGFLYMASFSD